MRGWLSRRVCAQRHSWRWWVVALLSSKIAIGPLAAGRNKTISTLEGTQKDLEGLLKNSEDEDYTETWSRPLKNHLNTIKNPKAGVLKPWAKSISFPLLKMTQKTIHPNCKLNFIKFFSTWENLITAKDKIDVYLSSLATFYF